jgi:small subunit ribosomal protein S3
VGQKIHPLKLRLGTTTDHQSVWYTKFDNYPLLLKQDLTLRNFIFQQFKFDSVSKVQISRNYEFQNITIKIVTGKPWSIISYGLSRLKDELKKLAHDVNDVEIDVLQIDKPNTDANLIADYVVDQLAKRVAFKRVMRNAIKRVQAEDTQGVKVQISGRLNGAEMARSEWIKEGRMPLQTLRANIDYSAKKNQKRFMVLWVLKFGFLRVSPLF